MDDFRNNGFERELEIDLQALLCPDVEWMQWRYKLKNGYSSSRDRTSFSIDITTCNTLQVKRGCKSDKDIERLLNSLVFTSYFVMEGIDFENPDNLGKRPVSQSVRYF